MRSNKTKEQIYRYSFSLFTYGSVPDNLLKSWIDNEDDSHIAIQEWCVNNMKKEIQDWCTGIGIIESVEHLYECAYDNGNLSFKTEIL